MHREEALPGFPGLPPAGASTDLSRTFSLFPGPRNPWTAVNFQPPGSPGGRAGAWLCACSMGVSRRHWHPRTDGCSRKVQGDWMEAQSKLLAVQRDGMSSLATQPGSQGTIPSAKLQSRKEIWCQMRRHPKNSSTTEGIAVGWIPERRHLLGKEDPHSRPRLSLSCTLGWDVPKAAAEGARST